MENTMRLFTAVITVIVFVMQMYMLGCLVWLIGTNGDDIKVLTCAVTVGVCNYILRADENGKKS